jgi:adenosylcobinamide amidohydrolase
MPPEKRETDFRARGERQSNARTTWIDVMPTHWEVLATGGTYELRRSGRFIVADLRTPHRVISTSVANGGQRDDLRYLLNHQSCEGTGHVERHAQMTANGFEAYHEVICAEAGVPTAFTATMGTAANMNYVAVVVERDEDVDVTAVVTAGVESNAVCAGDPAAWRETATGTERVLSVAGTINVMLLIGVPVTVAGLARAVVTMTEGKSAALQRLVVPSRQSRDLATGTGTDQYCVATPLRGCGTRTSTSPHVKLGELIGSATRKATQEALRWQNGLEPSYTRGVFHALGRYGITEKTFFDDIAPFLDGPALELLRKNMRSALYEPLVGAAAHACAADLDRVRHGTVPESVEREAVIQQAASLAASLAARPECWADFRARLHALGTVDPKTITLAGLAFGWGEKWRSQ